MSDIDPFAPTIVNGGGDYEPAPAGTHPAVVAGLIDAGTHWESYRNEPEKKTRKIIIVVELEANGRNGGARRFLLARQFNIAYSRYGELVLAEQAHLREFLERWAGRPFDRGQTPDLRQMVGRGCLAQVVHESRGRKTYSQLTGLSRLPTNVAPLSPSHSPLLFSAASAGEAPGAREGEGADWLPWILGEPVHQIVARCLERHGTGRKNEAPPVGADKERGDAPPARNENRPPDTGWLDAAPDAPDTPDTPDGQDEIPF
jgi:hypothetical protein